MTDRADTFARWCAAADAVRATTKRLEKRAVLAEYLATLDADALAVAARFLSGLVFPRHDMRTTQVGGRAVFDALVQLSGVDAETLHARAVDAGELGDLARELFADRPPRGVTLAEVADEFARLAATAGSTAKRAMVRELLASLGGAEAQYATKLLLGSGELRIGLKEAQVEEAVAAAFGRPLDAVRHANLLRGDVGEVAALARADRLADARLSLFHPLGFMLASPLATAEEIVAALPAPFAVEDKYDGIRCQAHVGPGRVALYSRTLDEITRGYPDVVEALSALHAPRDVASVERGAWSGGVILDGELLAYDPSEPTRALPFKALQRRLGRKTPDAVVLAEVPVQLVVYDVLAWDGALVLDEPYEARRARLAALGWPEPRARLTPNRLVSSADEVEAAFDAARAAGNEGVIAKALGSPYTPGRRGKLWVKLKKALATLDVVITGAERGHGRRAKVLSDYTFAVRASETDPTLLTVGKAYGGLTDAEIAELSERLHAITLQRFGRFHQVRPEVVLEVTFDVVQPSARHKSGYALRFPRIVRIRDDKPAAEVDTLDAVKRLVNGGL